MISDSLKATSAVNSNRADLIDEHLRQLLVDLRVLVPCDVAAAWLGRDDRPSLRVLLPSYATLPSLESARHMIFETTTEAARITDLRAYPGLERADQRAWLGVPLVLNGQRRGWVELLSTQPGRFNDQHVQQVELLVRYAAQHLAQLEATAYVQAQTEWAQRLAYGLEQALHTTTVTDMLQALLNNSTLDHSIVSATVVVPSELAYAFGVHENCAPMPAFARHLGDEDLITVIMHWTDGERVASVSLLSSAIVPCVYNGETMGWIALQSTLALPVGGAVPGGLQQTARVVGALLAWLRAQWQRELQAQQSVRMLVQQEQHGRSLALTQLMAGLADQLHAPVQTVADITRQLQRRSDLPDQAHCEMVALGQAADQMRDFAERVARWGQPHGTIKQALDLNEIVADAVALVRADVARRDVVICCNLSRDAVLILGARPQIQQVCLELLRNALDAVADSDDPQINIDLTSDAGWARLRISDNGCGIPDNVRDHLWMPRALTTANGTRPKLGLGLPIVAEIIKSHWGTIAVTSEVWQGSCVAVGFPAI